jgi:hypothetical protein
MSKITSAATLMVVGLFLLGMVMVPLGTASASDPVLKVGDRWGMGKEIDLGANVTSKLSYIDNLLKSQANVTIDRLSVDSKVAYYVLFEITGETATTYSITAKMAFRFATSANLKVTGGMPVAGTYGVYDNPFDPKSTVAKEAKTVSIDLEEKMGVVLTGTATVEKTSMAITNITWSFKGALSVEIDAKNIPDINTTGSVQIISYKDYDVGFEAVAGVDLYMDFTPALDLFQAPVVQGETWWTNETALTVAGSVNGHVNAHGLTDDIKAQIFTEELRNATGATDFPISFEKLNSPDGEIKNGKFGPYNSTVEPIKMRCMNGLVTHTVNGELKKYMKIQVNDGATFLYSQDEGFLAGMYMNMGGSMPALPEEAGYVTALFGSQVSMDPMDAKVVSDKIKSIDAYTAKLTSEVKGGGLIQDFFFKAPYLGFFFVALGAISIGILAFFMTRPRKP